MSVPAKGLVSPQALAAVLADPGVFVLDCRSGADGAGRAAFEQGHIPGAAHSDYAADGWRVKVGGAPGMMPELADIASKLGRLGVEPFHRIVVVPAGAGANDLAAAARIVWTIRMAGHSAIAILDGGYAGWTAAGLPAATGAPLPRSATDYRPGPPTALRRRATEVLAAVTAHSATLVDARNESFFQGREKSAEARVPGHIPGAVHIDYVSAYNSALNRLKSVPELEALYAGVPAGAVISYCNTGHTAALNWFALSEVLGRPDVALYDGSMTDWTQDPSRPVAS